MYWNISLFYLTMCTVNLLVSPIFMNRQSPLSMYNNIISNLDNYKALKRHGCVIDKVFARFI